MEKNDKVIRMVDSIAIILLIIIISYITAVYSNIPFIVKWRTIYIETAMSTRSKHWLATSFIPKSIIDDVINKRDNQNDKITTLIEKWQNLRTFNPDENNEGIDILDKSSFLDVFWEIEETSLDKYIFNNSELIANGYNNLYINKAGLDDTGTTIRTKMDEQVLAIDAKNGIMIVKVTGSSFVGKLAIVKDPSQVRLEVAPNVEIKGEKLRDLASMGNAILAINASGFSDPSGQGNGSKPYGLVIKDGKQLHESSSRDIMIGFDRENQLRIGKFKDTTIFRDAVEFKPALVLRGQKVADGTAGWGIQPRTAIGQGENGEVLLLVIDGRQLGYSIGATMEDLANIMVSHKAVNAINLDGGSSTLMIYKGQEITKPSNSSKDPKGRSVPNAFIVKPKEFIK